MPVSLDQFKQHLLASGLVSAKALADWLAGLPAGRQMDDSQQLARELVRQKKLTAHQAKEIYVGRSKTLVLGNYVILDRLGEGGMGMVLKAEHQRMDRVSGRARRVRRRWSGLWFPRTSVWKSFFGVGKLGRKVA